ncbi:N-acetylmuramoyl-L-alanine amidase [Polyangium jinanense]|nr:N-acetylmuramoyl-L-alanine amidase [Polyangium jinanense]
MESDTGILRKMCSGPATRGVAAGAAPSFAVHRRTAVQRSHGISALRAAAILFACGAPLLSCGSGTSGTPAPPPSDEQRAQALLDPAAALPPRAEVVALADAVAIASSRAGRTERGAALAMLAADLRARSFRLDQAEADAREALELYAAAASAVAGTLQGCEADRRRALLAGDLARDAAVSYRETYLASRRQAVLAPRTPCHAALERTLAMSSAYRPRADALRALEREGDLASEAASRGAPSPSAFAASPPPSGAVSPESAPPSSTSTQAASEGQVVVTPRDAAAAKEPVKLVSLEPFGSEKGGRVVIHLSGPTTFQVGTLGADAAAGKDARVFVDIARASAKGVPRETEVGGVVRRVRLGAQEGGGTRVVLDLAASLYRRVFYLPDPFRIVIDVSTRPPVRKDEQDASGKREVRRVVLDPGHGGNDTGAVGPTGLKEKDVTLDIAHRAATIVSRELGIETLLTRDDDTYVALDLRTARANAFHADLFVSVHCNASENGQARGPMTFSLDRVRDPEGLAMRVAARENASRPRKNGGEGDARSIDEEMALIASNLDVGDLMARSRHVADLVQRSALASLGVRWPDTKDQGTKTAGFFVLVGADMPAVLFETSFISNPDDEARLATADYRQKLADAVANAIRAYREGK